MDNQEHYCGECGYHNYDTFHDESWCSHKRGKSHTIVSGRETDCEDWTPRNHPDILKRNKILNFFKGWDSHPDMELMYQVMQCELPCMDDIPEDERDETEKEEIEISFLAKVYNAAIDRCGRIIGENFAAQKFL